LTITPLYSLTGLLVGILVGLTGVGGGSLMTPLLVLLFGFHPSVAVGTDLLYAATTKTAGSLVHAARQSIAWPVVGLLAAGSLPAAIASLWFMARLGHPTDAVASLITLLLGIMLVLTAFTLLLRQRIMDWAQARQAVVAPRTGQALTVLLGIALGVAVTLTSVGAGAIGATVLLLLYPKMPIARVVGTDIAHAIPLALISGAGHWYLGSIDLSLLASLLIGSIPGIIIGSLLIPRIRESVLRLFLAAMLLVVGLVLLF
jgi:uncharacterized membrane protein YfcA